MKISFLQDGLFSPATPTPHKFLISPKNPSHLRPLISPTNFTPSQTFRVQKHGSIFLSTRRDDFGRKASLQHDLLPSIGSQPSPILEKEPVLKPRNIRALKTKLPATIIGPPRKSSEGGLLSDLAKIYGKSKSDKPFFGKRPEEIVINNFHTARPMLDIRSPVVEQAKTNLKSNMVQNIFQQTFTPILPKNSPKEAAHVRTPSTLKTPRKEEAPVQGVQVKPAPAPTSGEANVPIIKKTQRKRIVSDLVIKVSPRKTSRKKPLESPQTLKSPVLKQVRERLQAEESLPSPTNLLDGADLSNYVFTNPDEKEAEEAIIGFSVKSRTIKNKNGRNIFISTLNGLSRNELGSEDKEKGQSVNTARSIQRNSVFSLKKELVPIGSIGTASTLESAKYRGYPRKQSTRDDAAWINEESSRDQDSVLQGLLGFIKDETKDLDECSFIDKRTEDFFDDSLVILA